MINHKFLRAYASRWLSPELDDWEVEETIVNLADEVISRIAPNFRFGFHQVDDVKQEAWVFVAREVLTLEGKYNMDRPLANFLAVFVHNKLWNWKRDSYARMSSADRGGWGSAKKTLMQSFGMGSPMEIGIPSETDAIVDINEIFDRIDAVMPVDLRADFLTLLHGGMVTECRKNKVRELLRALLIPSDTEETADAPETEGN